MDYTKIFNKNALKILEILKVRRLYFNQIYEETKIKSKNNLLKNLSMMEKLKIITKEQGKGNTFYSINYGDNMAVSFLHIIDMIKLQNLPFERKRAILEVIEDIKPQLAVVFGSTSKDNFKEDSDIDILLVVNDFKKDIAKNIGLRYGLKISPVFIKFSNLDIRDETIRHIIKTGYPITGEKYFYNEYKKI